MLPVTLVIPFSCSRFFPVIFFREIFLFKLLQVRVSFLLSYLLLYWLVRWVSKLASADAINSALQGYQIYLSNFPRTIRVIPRLLKGRFFSENSMWLKKNMPNHYLLNLNFWNHFLLYVAKKRAKIYVRHKYGAQEVCKYILWYLCCTQPTENTRAENSLLWACPYSEA